MAASGSTPGMPDVFLCLRGKNEIEAFLRLVLMIQGVEGQDLLLKLGGVKVRAEWTPKGLIERVI
jgi:hypothetical protein